MAKRIVLCLSMLLVAAVGLLLLTAAPAVQAAPLLRPAAAAAVTASGALVTQTFTLQAGWNTIYLEVEPINTSPVTDPDGDGPLLPAHTLTTLEAVFATLSCSACLESVWTWNVPVSRMDFIVDPAEGLWDQPGWKRYF
mgnify:FL=1